MFNLLLHVLNLNNNVLSYEISSIIKCTLSVFDGMVVGIFSL